MKNDFSTLANMNLVLINSIEPECDSCKMRMPILQKVKGILGNRIEIFKFNRMKNNQNSSKKKPNIRRRKSGNIK
jgi:thiol-disulfide isomerase/thioredoxin